MTNPANILLDVEGDVLEACSVPASALLDASFWDDAVGDSFLTTDVTVDAVLDFCSAAFFGLDSVAEDFDLELGDFDLLSEFEAKPILAKCIFLGRFDAFQRFVWGISIKIRGNYLFACNFTQGYENWKHKPDRWIR